MTKIKDSVREKEEDHTKEREKEEVQKDGEKED